MFSLEDDDQYVWRMVVPDKKDRYPEEPNCHPDFKSKLT